MVNVGVSWNVDSLPLNRVSSEVAEVDSDKLLRFEFVGWAVLQGVFESVESLEEVKGEEGERQEENYDKSSQELHLPNKRFEVFDR